MNEEIQSEEPRDNLSIIVCPGCLEQQQEGPHFCVKCGTPLTAFSTIGPFERIFAQGHMLRRAVSGPTSLLVVIGMWVLALPQFLALVVILPYLRSMEGWMLLLVAGVALLYGVLLYRVTKNYIRQKKSKMKSESDNAG